MSRDGKEGGMVVHSAKATAPSVMKTERRHADTAFDKKN